MYYVYFILLNNGTIYKGSTNSLSRRLKEHSLGKVKTTKDSEILLLGYEAYRIESDARRREKYLKTTEGRRLLRCQYRDVICKYVTE